MLARCLFHRCSSYNHKDHKAWQWIMPYAPKVIMEQRCAPLACGVYKQPPFPSATDTLANTHTVAAIIKRLFFIVANYRGREIPNPRDLI